MRKHYITLCTHDNTEVTYVNTRKGIETTFEKAVSNGFDTLVLSKDGHIINRVGFTDSEVDYFIRFLHNNIGTISELADTNA